MFGLTCYPLITVGLLSITLTLIQLWFKHRYNYWSRLKVPYLEPTLFLGNLKALLTLRTSFGDYFRALYAEPCFQSAPYFGFFILHTPALMLRDPQLIEQVLIKEFNNFPNRFEAADLHTDPMGALTLPLAKYKIWRKSRREISKLFTSGHIKMKMYPKLVKIAEQLEAYIERRVMPASTEASIIEVKEMCALYTTDVTSVLLYGIEMAGLQNGGCEMRKQCERLFTPSLRKIIDFFTIFFLPKSVRLLKSKVFTRPYANYMRRLVDERLKTGGELRGDSDDLIDLLLNMQQTLKHTRENDWLRHPDFIAAQVGIFLLAGFETSSSLIGFILYELAKQQQVQQKLRAELVAYFRRAPSEDISYKDVSVLPYLNMIVAEGLRLYPTAPFINRECLPNGRAQTLWFGEKGNCLRIPKDVPAYVSILGIHRDPKIWPNPELFDPQRFAPESVPSIKPMSYLPFGAGPHGCVGSRLGILQVKLGLVYILRQYRVETCERTVNEVKFDPKRFMLEAKGELYLKFIKARGCA